MSIVDSVNCAETQCGSVSSLWQQSILLQERRTSIVLILCLCTAVKVQSAALPTEATPVEVTTEIPQAKTNDSKGLEERFIFGHGFPVPLVPVPVVYQPNSIPVSNSVKGISPLAEAPTSEIPLWESN